MQSVRGVSIVSWCDQGVWPLWEVAGIVLCCCCLVLLLSLLFIIVFVGAIIVVCYYYDCFGY